ncbi:MAG: sortase [Candidatus Shapirobacteria bacterium]|nr:sortase [Candidatus Shapirobacteria bacterium]
MTKSLKYFFVLLVVAFSVSYFFRVRSSNQVTKVNACDDDEQCQHENAECNINHSDKSCCSGLVCMDHGVPSNNGECRPQPTNTPQPTSVPTSTPTNTPTATPTVSPEVTPTVTPEITLTPTEIPTPTPTSEPSNNNDNGGSGSNPGPYVCNSADPGAPSNLKAVALGGGKVRLTWNPAPGTHTTYAVAYGPSIGNYLYGDPNVGNVTSYTVLALNPGGKYCFYVQAQNDCRGGNPSNVVCTNQGVGSFRVLGATDNYNPLINGIKESYGGEVLGESTELMGTAEVVYSTDKLPSGNTLLEGQSISIPAVDINQALYQPQVIADQLAVGQHEVLNTNVNGSNVFYGHNGYDVFGTLYQVVLGNQVIVTKNNQKLVYTVTSTDFVKKDDITVLKTDANQIVMVTCSFTQPDYRIIVKASLQPQL